MKHFLLLSLLLGSLSCSAYASGRELASDKLTRSDSAVIELIQLWGYSQGVHDVLLQNPSPTSSNSVNALDSICFERAIRFIRHYEYPTPLLLGKYVHLEQTQALIPILLRNRSRLLETDIRELLQGEAKAHRLSKKVLQTLLEE